MIKAIIFDFFGVIGQSTYAMMREHFDINEEQSRQLTDLHKSLDFEFIGSKTFLHSYAEIVGITDEEMMQIYNNAEERFGTSQKLLDYTVELKKSYKIALLSNVSREAYLQFIDPIKDYFDVVVTSYHVRLAKPEMAIFEYCADQLKVDTSECVMIDDNYINCEGAGTAGMFAIQYKDFDQFKNDLSALLADTNN